jgi:phospholipid/cholesterol/gamma-HCH transport system substrate-binding protein
MKKRSQRIRLGIFIFISSLLLISMIVFFAARQLFEKSDNYYVTYYDVSVSGLEVGSPVEYLGIRIGSISNISIDPQDINSIIVELAVEAGTPIKQDTHADIVTMGITGLKAIEIRGGSNEARFLRNGEQIQPGASTTEEITGRANVIAEKAEKVINNLQLFTDPENLERFTAAADNINELAAQLNTTTRMLDSVISTNRTEIDETVRTARMIAGRLDTASQTFNEAIASVNDVIQGDTIQEILGHAHEISRQISETDLQNLIQGLAEMTDQTRVLLYKIDQELDMNSRDFNESVELLRITLSNLEETSNKINSNPSILVRGMGDKNIPDRRLKK